MTKRENGLAMALAFCLWHFGGDYVQAGQAGRAGPNPSAPPKIVFQHDGKNVSGFVLYLQPATGAPIRIDLGLLKPDASGLVSAALPEIPPGMYRAEVAAYNRAGESPKIAADPPMFMVVARPGAVAHPETNSAPQPASAPIASPEPQKKQPAPQRPEDAGAKKGGIGKRFWKVLVGDDDKP